MEKNRNAFVIENSAGQRLFVYKFVDPGTERGATEAELPSPSVTTETPKEGVIFEQDPVVGIQQNSQR